MTIPRRAAFITALVMMAVLVALYPHVALAATVTEYVCDFENGETLPPGWRFIKSEAAGYGINSNTAFLRPGSTRSLKQQIFSSSSCQGSVVRFIPPNDGIKYELEGWFYVDQAYGWGMTTTPFMFNFTPKPGDTDGRNAGIQVSTNVGSSYGYYGLYIGSETNRMIWSRNVPQKVWHNIKVTYDRLTNRETVMVDGNYVLQNEPMDTEGSAPTTADFYISGGWSPNNVMTQYLDNCVVRVWRVNGPPSIVASSQNVAGPEGGTITNGGMVSDPDGDTVTLTASRGTVRNNGDGTWSWSMTAADGPADSGPVTIFASDGKDGSASVTFQASVLNVAPAVSAPADATIDEAGTFAASGSFTDPGADSWTATVDYGDGSGTQPLELTADKTFALSRNYADNGEYTVTVTVTDDDGGVGTDTTTVTVKNVGPTVTAPADATIDEAGTFAASGSFTDPGADSWTATVDYGDGSGPTSVELNEDKTFALSHTYADNGEYTVTVTVTDDDGGVGTDTTTVTVNNVAPSVTGPDDATIDEAGMFSGSGRFADPGADSWTATVDYGDGSDVHPLELTADKTFALSHTYADNGTYTVTVTVTDDDGGMGTDVTTIIVNNVGPTVTAPEDATIDEAGTFSGDGSFTDPGADSWTATVDYGDGSGKQPLELGADRTFSLSHAYADNGKYTVTVTVTDDDGGVGTDTIAVTVKNVTPTVTAPEDATIDEAGTFSGSGSFTDPGVTDTHTATVDYGDGSGMQPLELGADKTFSLSHEYADNGEYTITVTVTDDDGGVGTDTTTVTVKNVGPTVTAPADVTIDEAGTFSGSGKFTDPGADSWTATVDYGDGSSPEMLELTADKTFALSHAYADNGTYTVTVTVTDDGGGVGTDTTTVTVNNVAPSVTGPDDATIDEAGMFSGSGRFADPGADSWTATVDYGDGSDVHPLELTADKTFALSHAYADNGTYTVTVTVTDDDGGVGADTTAVTVNNIAPTLGVIAADVAPVQNNTAVNATVDFTDPGVLDTHTAVWNWGDGTTSEGTIAETSGSGSASGSHAYPTAGVYTITVTLVDKDGGSDTASHSYVVVYDPSAGFVTGGGWFDSPAGAYVLDPSAAGKASFGFVSKYAKGATVPSGNTEFQLHAAKMNFKSTSYEWLVVAGAKGQYKGEGTINGTGSYGFMLVAKDGSPDLIRIKIWNKATGDVVYDNQMGATDVDDPTTTLGGGSIIIHH